MAVPLRYSPASIRRALNERRRAARAPQPMTPITDYRYRGLPTHPGAFLPQPPVVGQPRFTGHPVVEEPTGPQPAVPWSPAPEPTPTPEPGPAPSPAPGPAPVTDPTQGSGALSYNPQLEIHPLGRFTDAEYEAKASALRAQRLRDYQAVLDELGYTGPGGEHIMGNVEIGAARQRAADLREMGLAREQVTNEMQEAGTLFSGYRGVTQSRAEHPFVQDLSDLDIDTPRTLGGLESKARGILAQFPLDLEVLLQEAAGRYDPTDPTGALPPPPGAPTEPQTAAAGFSGTSVAREALGRKIIKRRRGLTHQAGRRLFGPLTSSAPYVPGNRP